MMTPYEYCSFSSQATHPNKASSPGLTTATRQEGKDTSVGQQEDSGEREGRQIPDSMMCRAEMAGHSGCFWEGLAVGDTGGGSKW